ncbi:ACSBG1 family protein [Megaselia abdita]
MSQVDEFTNISCALEKGVEILKDNSANIRPPRTIIELFNETCEKHPNKPALNYEDPNSKTRVIVDYENYQKKSRHVARSFLKLGLEQKKSVAVLAFNCPEWFFSEIGCISAGGILTGIYTTNSAQACHHILLESNTNICVVDNHAQFMKVYSVKDRLPNLKAIIQLHGPFDALIESNENFYKWDDIMEMENAVFEDQLIEREKQLKPNECCMLIFTSGTTGKPKGVMLSHDNIVWNTYAVMESFNAIDRPLEERFVSYLPLNHIAGQCMDVFLSMASAGQVFFADRNALKGTLIKTMLIAKPTRFLGVPRVFEKIQESIITAESRHWKISRKILEHLKSIIRNYHLTEIKGQNPTPTLSYHFASRILRRVKEAVGLDQASHIMVGAAPVSVELKTFFFGYNIEILELFGMSESTGCATFTQKLECLETCGKPMPGVEIKIDGPDRDGRGEICIRSRNIFMGYLNDYEGTTSCLKPDGWFYSGDLGYVTMSGELGICGRIKDIIITSGGENIPPAHIENLIKSELPALSNVFVIGDKRKYLTCLVTIKAKFNDETGQPEDDLQPDAVDWMTELGLKHTKMSEILEAGPCPIVMKAIHDGLGRANMTAISNAQKVQKAALLSHDFSIATGELGATLKVKRNMVEQIYKQTIDKLYEGNI